MRSGMKWMAAVMCTAMPMMLCAQIQAPAQGPMAAAMQPFLNQQDFAGVVTLVGTRDKVVDVEAAGYFDLATKKPMQTDDMFWIASMTKSMTATAMMVLLDQGKIKLDDPVEKYLPVFKNRMVAKNALPDDDGADNNTNGTESGKQRKRDALQKDASAGKDDLEPADHPFTIREMLSHTAGLRGDATGKADTVDHYSLADRVALYAKDPLLSQPGTHYFYANEDFNTAGRIIEVVSGMPYDAFMQKYIFDPLGMKDTTFYPVPAQVAKLAKTYTQKKGGPLTEVPIERFTYPLDDRKHRYPVASGGVFTTAADQAKFAQMLLDHGVFNGKRIISEDAWKAMTNKETPAAVKTPYGFGLEVTPNGFRHGGAEKTEMTINEKDGFYTVFFVQVASGLKDSKQISNAVEDTAEKIVAAQPK